SNGFQGLEGQTVPEIPDDFVEEVSERYIELYENITGSKFIRAESQNVEARIFESISKYLDKL
ncbi:MAG: phosphoribosylaminoimidazolesuccinocarboxamide synthase, partial [Bacteroidales bacterium]|nr:phosphoribosylaminoimidazolesuccinocarboxamide synthase [Bacteroidales bacterium]